MVKHQSGGFTLVELAIVLMIIGLLIGGILRGQELMENARVTGTIQQVKSYQGANHTFKDEYSNMPGDMAQALNRIPNCTSANSCGNGNGNGFVGVINALVTVQSGYALNTQQSETTLFWKHLALAHLISGVDPSTDILKPESGRTHPAAKIGGVFAIMYSSAAADFGSRHYLVLTPSPTIMNSGLTTMIGNLALSPINAANIDRKMDDGMPDTGDVTAESDTSQCEAQYKYLNTAQKNCMLYFKLD